MKTGIRQAVVFGIVGGAALTALACVRSFSWGDTCGQSQLAVPPSCVQVICTTKASYCQGPLTSYYCASSPFTASCAVRVWTLSLDSYGRQYCAFPWTPGADQAAPCHHVTAEITGC